MQAFTDSTELDVLLARIAAGDQPAFARLYDRMCARVFGLVIRIVGVRAAAEQVTHEAFLEIWQSACRRETAPGAGGAWIMRIAHRRAVEHARMDAGTPAYHAEVSPSGRQVVDLMYFDGLSQQDVATGAGIPLGDVRILMRRGLDDPCDEPDLPERAA